MRAPTATLLIALFLGGRDHVCGNDVAPARFVGRDECLSCHDSGMSAGACALRPIPQHRKACAALALPVAEDIALLSGIHTPADSALVCLACHATGADEGRRWWASSFKIADGVQCEACHGPGSLHVETHHEANRTLNDGANPGTANQYRDRQGAAHGTETRRLSAHDRTQASESTSIRRGQRWQCAGCHYELPSHRMVLEEGFRRAPADRRYKTPVNLTLSSDGRLLYVPCERSNSLIIVDTATQVVVDEIAVGKRPHAAAVDPTRPRIYVTNRLSDSVSAIDTESRKVVAEIAVGDDPHGLIVDPAGRWVFVLNTSEDTISVLDAEKLTEVRRLTAGRGPWSVALGNGGASAYVTSVRPYPSRFRDPPQSEITVIETERAVISKRLLAPGTNMQQGIAFSAGRKVALFAMMRTKNLVPMTRLAQGWTITNGLGVIGPDDRIDQVLLDAPNDYFPDPIGVAVSPDGHRALVTSGGSNEIAVIDVDALLEMITTASDRERTEVLPNHLGKSSRYLVERIRVGRNPRAVVFAPGGGFVYVANALDDSISVVDMNSLAVAATIPLGGPEQISELRRGERLFHSADITFGRQFSCRGCHPDGHTNGLTFDIEADGIGMHPVDNRSLRGIVDTAPFKWEGTNPTLSHQCGPRLALFFTRQAPYETDELAALVRYMCTIELPPNGFREPEGLTPAQRRGKVVFERTRTNSGEPIALEEQCAFCHNGGYLTNRTTVDTGTTMWFDAVVDADLGDLFNADQYGELGSYYFVDAGTPTKAFDVAHLRNIYDSAPYLHNGAAATLEEIWTRFNMVNRHGMTGDLTRQQFNDLIAYLKTL